VIPRTPHITRHQLSKSKTASYRLSEKLIADS